MPRSYASSYKPPKPKKWTVAGWRGMYDSRADVQAPDEAALLINLMPSDTERPGPVYLRPGKQTLGAQATAAQLGGGSHVVQWIGEVTFATGSPRVIAIADGEIWEVAMTGGTVTKRISTANLTTASITLSSSVACHCVLFDGTLVICDHATNPPFTWDGTAGSGLTSLTNAPATVTGVTVYYAKLFFIKNTTVPTIVWSEELQANTGYEAGGYNNAWELTQTSNDALTAILGTNEGLYYGRATSVGVVRGAVSSTFTTDGVHDSVYSGSGPESRSLWTYGGDTLLWGNFKGDIYAYRPGGEAVCITEQLPRMFGYGPMLGHASNATSFPVYGVGEDALSGARSLLLLFDPETQRLYAEYGSSIGRFVLVFDVTTLRLLSIWSYGTANDRPVSSFPSQFRFACMGRNISTTTFYIYTDSSGYVFQQVVAGSITGAANVPPTADYTEAGTGTGITGILLGPKHGDSHTTEWQFSQIDVVIDQLDDTTTAVGYLTSRQHKVSLTPADQTVTVANATNDPYEKRIPVGINANGRWIRPVITLTGSTSTTVGEQPPQLFGYTITGHPVSSTVFNS